MHNVKFSAGSFVFHSNNLIYFKKDVRSVKYGAPIIFCILAIPSLLLLANAQNMISWDHGTYLPNSSGIVEIVDKDLSLNPMTITTFQASVWSDSDLGGIRLDMVETEPNSGVFLGTVYFSTNLPSSGNRLHVSEGDTVTAEYIDKTLPTPYLSTQQLTFRTAASIASTSSTGVSENDLHFLCGYSLNGHLLSGSNSCPLDGAPTILSQVNQISPDVFQFLLNTDEKYYALMLNNFQCTECSVNVSKLCKYDQNGNLLLSFTEEQKKVLLDLQANYSFAICPFTENSSANQTQDKTVATLGKIYQDPLKQSRAGISLQDIKCDGGLQLVIKAEDNTPACVTPQTAVKLVDRGWAKKQVS